MNNKLTQEESVEEFKKAAKDFAESMYNTVRPEYNVLMGRRKLMTNYISESQVTDLMNGYATIKSTEDMVNAINEVLPAHRQNALEIQFLLDYAKGKQTITTREKSNVRKDINNIAIINYAGTFTRDIVGYTFGNPIEYIGKKTDDNAGNKIKEEIRLLNIYADMADKHTHDMTKVYNSSITGIAHRAIFTTKNPKDDDSPFYYIDLDSTHTFVAYNSQLGDSEAFACTYIESVENEHTYTLYTVYTCDKIYLFKTPARPAITIDVNDLVEGYPKPNPLGMIPIIESENGPFRMGHWESAVSLFDCINKVASDSVNDVEQYVNSILVAINAEFSEEQMQNVRDNKYAEITSGGQGLPADLKYISEQLDGSSVELLRQYLEDSLRAVVGIPDRKTRGGGGGDTGDAVKLRDGWADMEVVARTTSVFNEKSEKKELRIILKILKDLKKVSKTSIINVGINCPRNKNDNLNSKVTAYATLLNTETVAPDDALNIVDITSDTEEVISRGELYWQKKHEERFEEQQKQLESQGALDVTQEGGKADARTDNRRTDGSKPKPTDKQQ